MKRIENPDGGVLWKIGRYAEVKALLTDDRLGKSRSAVTSRNSRTGLPPGSRDGSELERAAHTQWRRTMSRVFSPPAFDRLTPRIRAIADDLAAGLPAHAGRAGAVWLSDSYSIPLTTRVMCEFLGIQPAELAELWPPGPGGAAGPGPGMPAILAYADRVAGLRRERPGDDAISQLLAMPSDHPRLHQGRVVKLVAGMLAFGRETPASVINWGALLLLSHDDQRRLLCERPALEPLAVEETLRLAKPPAALGGSIHRYAHRDIELADASIRAGDAVVLDLAAANRDEAVFDRPHSFDIQRYPNPHLAFGHGFYMCNFSRLVRAEVGIGLTTLFRCLPGLRQCPEPAGAGPRGEAGTGTAAGPRDPALLGVLC